MEKRRRGRDTMHLERLLLLQILVLPFSSGSGASFDRHENAGDVIPSRKTGDSAGELPGKGEPVGELTVGGEGTLSKEKGRDLGASNGRGLRRGRSRWFSAAGANVCTITVGSGGGFATIQEALDSIGQNPDTNPVTVCIASGVYRERVVVKPGQDGILFHGEGAASTIISGSGSLNQTGNTFTAATLIVQGGKFSAKFITIENTFVSVTDPAPAVSIISEQTRWDKVRFVAWDDTVAIYTGSKHLFKNCFVSGVTDMTWGFGRAAFVETEFFVRNFTSPDYVYTGDIATFGTDKPSNGVVAGALYWNCTIHGDGKAFLGRPYRPKNIVVFAYCYMGQSIVADGYNSFRNNLEKMQFQFLEYKSWGPGANKARKYGRVANTEPPRALTVQSFLNL